MAKLRIGVVGAGISGLATACCIQETLLNEQGLKASDYKLDVLADRFSPNLTSDVAGGFVGAYLNSFCKEDKATILKWTKVTWDRMQKLWLSGDLNEAGLQLVPGYVLVDPGTKTPDWMDLVLNYHELTPRELTMFPNYSQGYGFSTFIIEVTTYLKYLRKKLEENGVHFIQKKVEDLSELCEDYEIVVNCTGLEANKIIKGENVRPVRGQVLWVKAPWVKNFVLDLTTLGDTEVLPATYILPNTNFLVLGGTHEVDECNMEIEPEVNDAILQKCGQIIPGLERAEIVEAKCGLRPARHNVRLEKEKIQNEEGKQSVVVHNYGHGGGGITFHMGCGIEAAELVLSAVKDVK